MDVTGGEGGEIFGSSLVRVGGGTKVVTEDVKNNTYDSRLNLHIGLNKAGGRGFRAAQR